MIAHLGEIRQAKPTRRMLSVSGRRVDRLDLSAELTMRHISFPLLLALAIAAPASAQLIPIRGAGSPPPPAITNTMSLTDASGAGETNYPLQFGRPFIAGAIPSGQCPTVAINGMAAISQADVKNRYPDGSAEYAVMAVVVPRIPAKGSVTVSFAPGTCNNTPLTAVQMLAPSYNFDAAVTITPKTGAAASFSGDATNAATMLANGDYKLWTSGPVAQTVLLGDDTVARKYDIGFGDGFHPVRPRYEATFWPAAHQVFVRIILENDLTTELEDTAYLATVTGGATSPVTEYQLDLTGTGNALGQGNTGLTVAVAHAATGNGNLTLAGTPKTPLSSTHGYVAQDTATGEWFEFENYGTSVVAIQARGVLGSTAAAMNVGDPILIGEPKVDFTLTRWTKTFWLGGTPNPEVNQDFNLAYVESTRFLPNFDPSIVTSPTAIANNYATWQASAHDNYDGRWDGGMYPSGEGQAGANPWIGPYPAWTTSWLASHGDWREAEIAYNLADNGAQAQANLRERATGHRFARTDAVGSSTGLGLPPTNAGRPTLYTANIGRMFSYVDSAYPSDAVIKVGAVNLFYQNNVEDEHQPAMFFPQYILSGDPFYLQSMENWAAFSTGMENNASNVSAGPNFDDDAIGTGITRAWAWVARNRAEVAFAEPDGTPQKAFFTYAMNDALAREEGGFGIIGTPYDGSTLKVWGASMGSHFNSGAAGVQSKIPPLTHEWASDINVQTYQENQMPPPSTAGTNGQYYLSGTIGAAGDVWMQEYVQYALGRIAELGFAARPLQLYSGKFFDEILSSTQPKTISMYLDAPADNTGAYFPDWQTEIDKAMNPAWISGVGYAGAASTAMPVYWAANLNNNGREVWGTPGIAMLVDAGDPAAPAEWAWWLANVYTPVVNASSTQSFGADPWWNIVPRTDANVLPAQPTTIPPG
jgi:hypothetical protein